MPWSRDRHFFRCSRFGGKDRIYNKKKKKKLDFRIWIFWKHRINLDSPLWIYLLNQLNNVYISKTFPAGTAFSSHMLLTGVKIEYSVSELSDRGTGGENDPKRTFGILSDPMPSLLFPIYNIRLFFTYFWTWSCDNTFKSIIVQCISITCNACPFSWLLLKAELDGWRNVFLFIPKLLLHQCSTS